jgi:hypothetical protein
VLAHTLDAVRSVVAFLGANNILLAIVGLVAAPFVDKLFPPERRSSSSAVSPTAT